MHTISTAASPAATPGRPLRRLGARSAALLAAALVIPAAALGFGAATPAHAHDQLIDTVIETGEEQGPEAVRLTFNNVPLAVGSEVRVSDADGESVVSGEIEVVDRDVVQRLAAPLQDGVYRVVWRVVSSDGHPIDGSFGFEVSGTEAEIVPLDEAGTGNATEAGDAAEEDETAGNPEGNTEEGTQNDAPGGSEDGAEENSGVPVGAWVAIGVAVAVALGVGPFAVRRRKQQIDAAAERAGSPDGSPNGSPDDPPSAPQGDSSNDSQSKE